MSGLKGAAGKSGFKKVIVSRKCSGDAGDARADRRMTTDKGEESRVIWSHVDPKYLETCFLYRMRPCVLARPALLEDYTNTDGKKITSDRL